MSTQFDSRYRRQTLKSVLNDVRAFYLSTCAAPAVPSGQTTAARGCGLLHLPAKEYVFERSSVLRLVSNESSLIEEFNRYRKSVIASQDRYPHDDSFSQDS